MLPLCYAKFIMIGNIFARARNKIYFFKFLVFSIGFISWDAPIKSWHSTYGTKTGCTLKEPVSFTESGNLVTLLPSLSAMLPNCRCYLLRNSLKLTESCWIDRETLIIGEKYVNLTELLCKNHRDILAALVTFFL